jgi:hypothetical protein
MEEFGASLIGYLVYRLSFFLHRQMNLNDGHRSENGSMENGSRSPNHQSSVSWLVCWSLLKIGPLTLQKVPRKQLIITINNNFIYKIYILPALR